MANKHIHIVSFDIPYPPNYGGAIDVFYSLQALAKAGVSVTLHCTYKGTLTHYAELEQLCREVYYYPRTTSLRAQLSLQPYGITSRKAPNLLANLLKDDDPILFEGLVSCGYMAHPALAKRNKIFRECNIEHDYLRALAKATSSWWKKIFYRVEARKQERYEKVIAHATSIAAVAHQDERHFQEKFPRIPTHYIPSFHAGQSVDALPGKGDYILYHGNLQLAENENAALFLLREVVPGLPNIRFVLAGRQPSARLKEAAATLPNVTLEASPSEDCMQTLIREAHIHLLPTFQGTGLKLKLLNVLYHGRYVVVNPQMIHGTDVASLCLVAPSAEEMIRTCEQLMQQPFTEEEKNQRQKLLRQIYNNEINLAKLMQLL